MGWVYRGPAWWNETFWGKTWGQRAATWGGFRGQAGTRGCDKGTSGDTGLGLGDQHGGLHEGTRERDLYSCTFLELARTQPVAMSVLDLERVWKRVWNETAHPRTYVVTSSESNLQVVPDTF